MYVCVCNALLAVRSYLPLLFVVVVVVALVGRSFDAVFCVPAVQSMNPFIFRDTSS